jgi:hypothetical protein
VDKIRMWARHVSMTYLFGKLGRKSSDFISECTYYCESG